MPSTSLYLYSSHRTTRNDCGMRSSRRGGRTAGDGGPGKGRLAEPGVWSWPRGELRYWATGRQLGEGQ